MENRTKLSLFSNAKNIEALKIFQKKTNKEGESSFLTGQLFSDNLALSQK